MRVTFRVDASLQMGSGHVMRCLTLATELKKQGAICQFICREHRGSMLSAIQSSGFTAYALPMLTSGEVPIAPFKSDRLAHADWLGASQSQDATQTQEALKGDCVDWLVVDHYAIDTVWEKSLRPYCKRLLVIDDLADRRHECDLLLDQNLGREMGDYQAFVPPHCRVLVGPMFSLLRPEFATARVSSLQRRIQPRPARLLVTMGGIDQPNATSHVLYALRRCDLPANLHVTVVMGALAPWLAQIRALASTMPWPTEVLVDIKNMAKCMVQSDLAVGAAGGTAWERCCLGLPTITMITADNQRAGAIALDAQKATILIQQTPLESQLADAFKRLLSGGAMREMTLAASKLVDGLGVKRLTSAMEELQ